MLGIQYVFSLNSFRTFLMPPVLSMCNCMVLFRSFFLCCLISLFICLLIVVICLIFCFLSSSRIFLLSMSYHALSLILSFRLLVVHGCLESFLTSFSSVSYLLCIVSSLFVSFVFSWSEVIISSGIERGIL